VRERANTLIGSSNATANGGSGGIAAPRTCCGSQPTARSDRPRYTLRSRCRRGARSANSSRLGSVGPGTQKPFLWLMAEGSGEGSDSAIRGIADRCSGFGYHSMRRLAAGWLHANHPSGTPKRVR
jgi:hypothetical protein